MTSRACEADFSLHPCTSTDIWSFLRVSKRFVATWRETREAAGGFIDRQVGLFGRQVGLSVGGWG